MATPSSSSTVVPPTPPNTNGPSNGTSSNRDRVQYTGSLETNPSDAANSYKGTYIPNTPLGASVVSVLLSITFTLGLVVFFRPDAILGGLVDDPNGWTPLGFFLACWAGFHWGEYAVAAGWNRSRCSVDSFLLENGAQYHIANITAITEFVITMLIAPQFKKHTYITYFGIALTLIGQYLRSIAMITAAANFSHQIVTRRESEHKLVTTGIYAYLRHPSYTGFYYWSLGTQLILQNPISFVGFAIVAWRFFAKRIPVEERFLVHFFGDDYRNYRRTVGTWIPFIA